MEQEVTEETEEDQISNVEPNCAALSIRLAPAQRAGRLPRNVVYPAKQSDFVPPNSLFPPFPPVQIFIADSGVSGVSPA